LRIQQVKHAKTAHTKKYAGKKTTMNKPSLAPPKPIMGEFLKKFPLADKPHGDFPELPGYLDELPDPELMELYTKFISWGSYAKSELVQSEIIEERTATNQKFYEATTLINQWGEGAKGDTVTLAKARRDVDPEVMNATDEYLEARAFRKLTESVFERCERGAQVISRELSRRISMAPSERRQGRYTA